MKRRILILLLFIWGCIIVKAQNSETNEFYTSIKKYNLSKLWSADSIITQDDGERIVFPEPLGFIGDNYQRFEIHYTSVKKDKSNPYRYNVLGKTRVKNNICCFSGSITVIRAKQYKKSDSPEFKQGFVDCKVELFEDSIHLSSGYFNGNMTTYFCIDKKGTLSYDALMIMGDEYSNNQCKATWTSYKTKITKKCNWGDYRIPDSGNLDTGTGEFMVNEKYRNSGWDNYMKAWQSLKKTTEIKDAQRKEDIKWWK
ncbi:hypothetical protein [Parabacteroides sp. FAFU027]|uniref:hypothetical protein n=1 Tax=Parabacteroides sp. FAFU027 TaxID=2922715 RepID=UPI001FAEB5FE|nr:hypothetical protein [Parabacteroides sp. FAFU027]